jgi:hypothetical protein
MSCNKAGWGRIALLAAVSFGVMTAFCGDAVAKHGHHLRHRHLQHRRKLAWYAHRTLSSDSEAAQVAWSPSARLRPMRYYGGPKSPMWRAPAEN